MHPPIHWMFPWLVAAATAIAVAVPSLSPPAAAAAAAPTCDFNADGYGDVPVGVPGEDFRAGRDAGGVNVLYGTSSGTRAAGAQWWTRRNTMPGGSNVPGGHFGLRLACGDFDGDGAGDLAITTLGLQEVTVLYGTTAAGLTAARAQRWSGMDAFAVVAGDFDRDGFDELAIGAPDEDGRRGAVYVLPGTAEGLTDVGLQRWTQDSPGVRGTAEPGDVCGYDLERGDFDGDGHLDLVWSCREAGDEWEGLTSPVVQQLQGSESGLLPTHSHPVPIPYELHLAAGDFNGDGRDDLANTRNVRYGTPTTGLVGGPVRNSPNGHPAAGDFNGDGYTDGAWGKHGHGIGGIVVVAYGSRNGIDMRSRERWHPDRMGVKTRSRRADQFGWAVTAINTDGGGADDLIISARLRDIRRGDRLVRNAGAIHVLRGSAGGITAAGDRFLHQGRRGVPNALERGDAFGQALAGDGQ